MRCAENSPSSHEALPGLTTAANPFLWDTFFRGRPDPVKRSRMASLHRRTAPVLTVFLRSAFACSIDLRVNNFDGRSCFAARDRGCGGNGSKKFTEGGKGGARCLRQDSIWSRIANNVFNYRASASQVAPLSCVLPIPIQKHVPDP
jgi:hypothetical protein